MTSSVLSQCVCVCVCVCACVCVFSDNLVTSPVKSDGPTNGVELKPVAGLLCPFCLPKYQNMRQMDSNISQDFFGSRSGQCG